MDKNEKAVEDRTAAFSFSGKKKQIFVRKKRLRQSIMESSNITAYKNEGRKTV